MFAKGCDDPVTIGIWTKKKLENTDVESKIGGSPIWIDKEPEQKELTCKYCHQDLRFVSQIYAPDEGDRCLYIFGCINYECSQKSDSWVCIRQQRKQVTPEIVEKPKELISSAFGTVNLDSFNNSTSTLSTIASTTDDDLFSLLNQFEQKPQQKKKTKKDTKTKNIKPSNTRDIPMFPCYHVDFIEEKSEASTPLKNIEIPPIETGSEEQYESNEKDKLIIKFYQRLSRHSRQVIRYAYDGLPLLPCNPPTKICPPKCKCGGERLFECQILSNVISLFHIEENTPIITDSATQTAEDILKSTKMDFSSLLIYCCENSCNLCDKEYIYVLPPL
ncbi:hypothetical protein WA158_002336 [Blastocystis sp. Blastoise]